MSDFEQDELERAGRALRESVDAEAEPNDRVRARARTITRHRRMFAAGSIATVVLAGSIGVAVAVSGSDGLGVHTIPPAGSSTTVESPTTTTRTPIGSVRSLPLMSFADAQRGWRVELGVRQAIEVTNDGGRTWTAQFEMRGSTEVVGGVEALGGPNAFALLHQGNVGVRYSEVIRTTDGVHWARTRGDGLRDPLNSVTFADARSGWGLTRYGDLVKTADGGETWAAMTQPDTTGANVRALCAASAGSGWVATGRAVYRSNDDGATWTSQATVREGGGTDVALVCHGDHAAYASYDGGAGQHTGAFLRTDDGGARWRAFVEDSGTMVTVPGFPDSQFRGAPTSMSADGTLVFIAGGFEEAWVVVASPADRFAVRKFVDPAAHFEIVAATAVDASQVFAEVRRLDPDSATGGAVTLWVTSDGGQTWEQRSTSGK